MIQINQKYDCVGCTACKAVCPKHCIEMRADDEGFLYALADSNKCIDCHLCEKVCPVINRTSPRQPRLTLAAKNPDSQVRLASSSGGIFTLLAQQTLRRGGVVFGASYDKEWQVRHIAIDKEADIVLLQGSKYMQSLMGNSFSEAEAWLKDGREVLFSGTPCQIAGLKKYLRRDYPNLATVDIVCHGVPSPLIWSNYLRSINPQQKPITQVNMRDKTTGWQRYSITIGCDDGTTLISERASHNTYMRGFLSGIFTRPSCFQCPAKGGRGMSDITLGDFWGIGHVIKEMADSKGVGLVMAHSERGVELLGEIDFTRHEALYTEALRYNPCIERSSSEPALRSEFWAQYRQAGIQTIEKILPPKSKNPLRGIIKLVKRIFKIE